MPRSSARVRTLSGIQPTGRLHVGNYLGALLNFLRLQADHDGYFMIADLHSLTEAYDPHTKTENIFALTAAYLAVGLDPKKSTLFLQSAVPAHTELAWIFNTVVPVGELERMTQYKDKRARQGQQSTAGLLTYPALMAADILLYQPPIVPVGEDQTQHLELTRTIARKFNKKFGPTFTLPKPLYTSVPRLMSLMEPNKKMSKSEPGGCLFLDDPPEVITRKLQRAVTDTGTADETTMSPGVGNLFTLLEAFAPATTVKAMHAAYHDGSLRYRELKETLARETIASLAPFQQRFATLLRDHDTLERVLRQGARRATRVANTTMETVWRRIGIPRL